MGRARDVDQQHDGELALLGEAFDVRLAGARRDVPVDRAHVVAGQVLAHLGELHPPPLEDTLVLTGEEVRDHVAGSDLDLADRLDLLGGEHGRTYGTGTPSKMRWAMVVGGHVLGLGLVRHDDAMPQHVGADALDVLRRHVAPAFDERVRLRCERQKERRPRRRAVLDERAEVEVERLGVARRDDEIDDVLLDLVVDVDRVDQLARGDDVGRRDDLVDLPQRFGRSHAIENHPFLLARRVVTESFNMKRSTWASGSG